MDKTLEAHEHLLIFGASTRAAAFSALRAQLRPWCADLFGDADLRARCPTMRVPASRYPRLFLQLGRGQLPGPWMYCGGLENRPSLVHQIAQVRPLWGNDQEALAAARSPLYWAVSLSEARISQPAVRAFPEAVPGTIRWLLKPIKGAGGSGIRFWTGKHLTDRQRREFYFQEYIDGDSCAALYLGSEHDAQLLGVTRQLVGESWLHARPFHYCGSVGPIEVGATRRMVFEHLGAVLARACRLRGLFGVDCVIRDGVPYPVEINPRYTASVEVLEYATGIAALALHRQVFDSNAPATKPVSVAKGFVAKAILFAQAPLIFPGDGPWIPMLDEPNPVQELPAFADIPDAGERIEAGQPILTFFARAASPAGCLDSLQQTAAALDHWLFKR